MSTLPPRTADTMSDAIAMSSPNGRRSKRAQAEATRRLSLALFGPGGLTREMLHGTPAPVPPLEAARDKAARLRGYATMAGKSQAKKLIAQAEAIEREYSL